MDDIQAWPLTEPVLLGALARFDWGVAFSFINFGVVEGLMYEFSILGQV